MTVRLADPSASVARPLGGATRAVRVGLLGGSSLLLATAAHTAGGGTLPAPGVLVAAGFVLGLLGLVATRRRVRFAVLLAGLALQQGLLHVLFDTASAAAAGCHPGAGAHAAMAGAGAAVHCAPTMAAMGPDASMLLAHIAAILATAWLLARGERWWWRTASRVVAAAGTRPAARTMRRARPVTPVVRRAVRAVPGRRAAPRGPPAVLA